VPCASQDRFTDGSTVEADKRKGHPGDGAPFSFHDDGIASPKST
jgi:hypothetical protein